MNRRCPAWAGPVALLTTVCAGLGACDQVTIPSAPTEPITLGIVQIETVTPVPGTSFTTAAGSQSFSQRVFYQRTDADFAQSAEVPLFFWMESFDRRNGAWEWEGDIAVVSRRLSSQSGIESLSGAFRIPRISPFCGPIDRLRALTVVGVDIGNDGVSRIPRGGLSNKESLSQNFNLDNFAVTGAQSLNGPCVITFESVIETDFSLQWGEPVWVWGRRLPGTENPKISFGGGEVIDFSITSKGGDFEDWDLVQSWVPARAEAGAVQVVYSSGEADYGSDAPPEIDVDVEAGDFFEPNDTWTEASVDPLAWDESVGWAINPGLTIDDVDQQPDGAANPLGLTDWGRGDWWKLETPLTVGGVSTCVDVFLFQEDGKGDDIDVLLFQGDFRLIDSDIAEGTNVSRVTGSPLGIWNGQPVEPTLYVWVAPWSITSEVSRYSLFALNCNFLSQAPESAAGLALERGPDGQAARPVTREVAEAVRRAKGGALAGYRAASTSVDPTLSDFLEAVQARGFPPSFRVVAERRLEEATAPVFLGALPTATNGAPARSAVREPTHATKRR